MRQIAEQLIAHETRSGAPTAANPEARFTACETLRPHLATFMGSMGARALLARALALASVEVHWLRALQVGTDGSLDGTALTNEPISPEDLLAGRVAVLAHLLGLMVTFIGEALTLQLALDAWPKLSIEDLHRGDANETTKTRQ